MMIRKSTRNQKKKHIYQTNSQIIEIQDFRKFIIQKIITHFYWDNNKM